MIVNTKTYWVIRYPDGSLRRPNGVSTAPHLYRTEGIANGIAKNLWNGGKRGGCYVEPVTLSCMGSLE